MTMLRSGSVIVSLAILATVSTASRAKAWNETGHKAVALIACFELKDAQKMAMFKLLMQHPHANIVTEGGLAVAKKQFSGTNFFTADRPSTINEVDWAIVRAATWPDFVRPPKFSKLSKEEIAAHEIFKYHRGEQHFDNKLFVVEGFKGTLPDNKGTILATLTKVEQDIQDPKVSESDKAIALCWLLHLIGDIHQPLHCVMLVSQQFPRGDEGGNKMLLGSTNLHSFWDELLGRPGIPFPHLDDLATTIHRAPQWQKDALKELKATTYEAWAAESFELAKTIAYANGTLPVASSEHTHDDGTHDIPPFPSGYKTEATPIAQRRIALAGYRLAAKLSSILPVKGQPTP
jgi:hypothetical protein